MKYSINQLKKYVPDLVSVPVDELVSKIWTTIAEVETIEKVDEKYTGVVVAKILTVEPHPKSEKLVVVSVDYGKTEPVTVVTAAHNVQRGDFVPYIPEGEYVPVGVDEKTGNRIQIGVRAMGGIPSVGMLASEREMGVSDDHTGIMILRQEELRQELVVGKPIAAALELDDVIIEIENKSLTHRGDCFSAAGLAREIATMYNFELKIPEWQLPSLSIAALMGDSFDKELPCNVRVAVSATSAVERYSAVVLDGVQVGVSPLWLRIFLTKHGVNAVNNIVDIANYVMLDYGQPMHAFDAGMVVHKKRDEQIDYSIEVRYAKASESLTTLDGKEKKLPASVVVIADAKKPLAIAGIIGGLESGTSEKTARIILEVAVFNKHSIRNASMTLGKITDGSVVYSRKQDPEKTVRALLRAVHLMQEMAGAKVASSIADVYPKQQLSQTLIVSHQKLEEFLGLSVSPAKVIQVLEGLGCSALKKNGMYRISTPTWRPDLVIDEDIYEEIARMVGYNEISPELPKRGIFGIALSKYEQAKRKSFASLVGLGLTQTMNFSFVSKELYQRAQVSLKDARSISNAISPDVEYIRKHLMPQLLDQLSHNQYNSEKFGLYEFGKTSRKELSYTGTSVSEQGMPDAKFGIDELGLPIEDEHLVLGIVDDSEQPAFFTLKCMLTRYLQSLRVLTAFVHPDEYGAKQLRALPLWAQELLQHYKRGRVAIVLESETKSFLGIIGEPGTLVVKNFGLQKKVATTELTFAQIVAFANLEPAYKEPSKYPTVTEDFCFEVPNSTTYGSVMNVYQEVGREYAEVFDAQVEPRDIYQKKPEVKQITHRVVYAPLNERFTDDLRKQYRVKLETAMKKIQGKLV
jgi:phenylalanyl-tRNA synthetase beta chain